MSATLPLLEEILRGAPPRRGPRSARPPQISSDIWANWRREVTQRNAPDSIEAFWSWLPRHLERRRNLRRTKGPALEGRERAVPEWEVVVPRRDLSPALEASWRSRILRGDVHGMWRIGLLGVQRLVRP